MRIKIYQIDLNKDTQRIAFESLNSLELYTGSSKVDSSIYDCVYETAMLHITDLEEVYRIFNLDRPKDFKGHSLSVSDVVEIIDVKGKSTYHFCDSFGFKEIEFDKELTTNRTDDKGRTLKEEKNDELQI